MKLQSFLGIVILILMACAAGCTREESPSPEPKSPILPGQSVVAIGDVTGGGQLGGVLNTGTIDTITVRAGLVTGAKPVSMEDISIVYADAVRTESLQPVGGFRGPPGQGTWGIMGVENEAGRPNNRLEDHEEFVIRINPKAPIVPRELFTIVVRPRSGTPLTLRRLAPPKILAENNILVSV
jgi:archaellin